MGAKKIWILTAVLGMTAVILAVVCWNLAYRVMFIPPLSLIGDIKNCGTITSLEQIAAPQTVTIDKIKYKAVKLTELLQKAEPDGQPKELYFSSNDGFVVMLDADSLEESYLAFGGKGWELLNPNHPISANAKYLSQILIVSENVKDASFGIVWEDNVLHTSIGALYTGNVQSCLVEEGLAKSQVGQKEYHSHVYTRRNIILLHQLGISSSDKVLLFCQDGSTVLTDGSGSFELNGNRIKYLEENSRRQIEGVRYAMVNPPAASIGDVYYHASQYIKQNKPVVLLLSSDLCGAQADAYLSNETVKAIQATGLYPIETELWLNLILRGQSDMKNSTQTLMQQTVELGKQVAFLNCPDVSLLEGYETREVLTGQLASEITSLVGQGYGLIAANLKAEDINSVFLKELSMSDCVVLAAPLPKQAGEEVGAKLCYADLCATYFVLQTN